jgi:hypothetical protein
VVSKPIEMTQEFRYFDFASPWEQMSRSDKSNKSKQKLFNLCTCRLISVACLH